MNQQPETAAPTPEPPPPTPALTPAPPQEAAKPRAKEHVREGDAALALFDKRMALLKESSNAFKQFRGNRERTARRKAEIEEEVAQITAELKQMGKPAVDTLCKLLEHEDHDVRRNAAELLGLMGDVSAAAALEAALREERRLGRPRDLHYSAYRGCLETPIISLGQLKAPEAVPVLTEVMNGWGIGVMTPMEALGEIGTPEAAEAILQCKYLKSHCEEAFEMLARMGEPAIEPLAAYPWATAPWEVKEHAARALGKLNDPRCVPPLIAILESRPLSEDAIEAAVEALGIIGDARAIPVLAAFARDDESVKELFVNQRAAAIAIGKIGGPEAIRELTALSKSKDPLDANAAAYSTSALGLCGPAAIPALTEAIEDKRLVERACGALLAIDDPAATAVALRTAEKHKQSGTREMAMKALIKAKEPGAVLTMIEIISKTRRDTVRRRKYMDGLGKIRPEPESVPALLSLLQKKDLCVRLVAARSLLMVGDASHVETGFDATFAAAGDNVGKEMEQWDFLYQDIIDCMRRLAPDAPETIIASIGHRSLKVVQSAARRAASLGDKRALPVLKGVISRLKARDEELHLMMVGGGDKAKTEVMFARRPVSVALGACLDARNVLSGK